MHTQHLLRLENMFRYSGQFIKYIQCGSYPRLKSCKFLLTSAVYLPVEENPFHERITGGYFLAHVDRSLN